MKQVNLYEAKTNLSALVEEAAAGQEIVIAKNGKPMAKLVTCAATSAKPPPRKLGLWDEANKNFDWEKWERESKALDEDIERLFNEGDGPSALDGEAPSRKRKPAKGFAEKKIAYKSGKGRKHK
jgi:prevent-host-death family protein